MNKCQNYYRSFAIPLQDLRREYAEIKTELDEAYFRVMNSGWFILGDEVSSFESEFAKSCGAKFSVGVDSGLDALLLTLDAWGIGEGDEVILPANTFIATAHAVARLGAKPVFIDVEEASYNLDIKQLESLITEKTKVIIPVYLYGQMPDMHKIMEIARKHKLKVLSDAAQAHGASYHRQIAGSIADATAFSFYPIKNLGCFGNGGLISTDDGELAAKLKVLRNYGAEQKNNYDYIAYNSRLDELQAAFLRVKLKRLDEWNKRRQVLAEIYLSELANLDEITLPQVANVNEHAWYAFIIRVKDNKRNELQEFLAGNGISTNVLYPKPIHLQNCYHPLGYKIGDFPVTETLANEILNLPISPQHSEEEIRMVSYKIREFYAL